MCWLQDVQGNEDGSGVLLDSDGNVAGMILKKNENDGDNIHAVSISQILPLVEHLANKRDNQIYRYLWNRDNSGTM